MNEFCIISNIVSSFSSVSKVCPPCDNELKADNIMEHYCASDFGEYLPALEFAIIYEIPHRSALSAYMCTADQGACTDKVY